MSTEAAPTHMVEVLGRVPLFQGLLRADLERIAKIVRTRDVPAGEFVFRDGDAGDRLYIVGEGAVEILKERPLGDHERLVVKRNGESFGEKSLLYDAVRSVSVRALDDTRLLTVSREDFETMLGGDSMPIRLMRGLAKTVRGIDSRIVRDGASDSESFRQFGRLVLQGLEPREAPQAEGFRIVGAAAREPGAGGGSLWDGFTTEDRRTLLSLTDVRGTGLPPAYLIGITRALLHEVAPAERFERVLRRLNAGIFENLFEGLDECVETALIEVAGGTVRWSCAGDQPGIILHGDGRTAEAPTHGPPLGILPQFDYGATRLDLHAGDTFLAFSGAPPGVIKGAMEAARGRTGAEPVELARLLQGALQKVQGHGAQTDVSFLLVRKV